VVSIGLDGKSTVPLLSDDKRDFKGNPFLGEVVDFMPTNPRRVLMQPPDFNRGFWALYYVHVYSGASERVELGNDFTTGWICQNGVPVLRYDVNARGTVWNGQADLAKRQPPTGGDQPHSVEPQAAGPRFTPHNQTA